MSAVFLRLLTILALAMMPVGMASAAAGSANFSHGGMMSEGHCPDSRGDDTQPTEAMDCTAACSALPVVFAEPDGTGALDPQLPRDLSALRSFEQTIPEIATPPPKLS